jgi:aryl-alcohol dehydrogenase-like predicted oxidoreductase
MIARRRFGRTGLSVPACTLGTGALRLLDPADARRLVQDALELGVDAFELDAGDVAAVAAVGAGLERRDDAPVFVRATSLIPFDLPSAHVLAHQAYSGAHLRAEVEALLRVLGAERLALVQLHAWCSEWLREGDWLEALQRLRAEGKIAGIGISLFDHDVQAGAEAAASGAIDAVQLLYNVFDPSPAPLVSLCGQLDVAVIARSPLHYGALAWRGDEWNRAFAADDWRAGYFYPEHRAETRARVERVAGDVGSAEGGVVAAALRFPLSHPAVSTVAVGARTPEQLRADAAAIAAGPLSAEACAALLRHRWLC